MRRPRLLDLYSCEGGAAMGYRRAGFEVVGVDINPQPRYPFEFHQADALEYLAEHHVEFDAVHASPPCHDWSSLKSLSGLDKTGQLLPATRAALIDVGLPYVIENVIGAPMVNPIILCGSEFGRGAVCSDGVWRYLKRHRQFESNIPLQRYGACNHAGQAVGVYGTGGGGQMTRGYKAKPAEAVSALGIDWMSRAGLSQSLPPDYTEWIGEQIVTHIALELEEAS